MTKKCLFGSQALNPIYRCEETVAYKIKWLSKFDDTKYLCEKHYEMLGGWVSFVECDPIGTASDPADQSAKKGIEDSKGDLQ